MWIYVWNLGTLVSSWALNILTKRSQTLKTLKTFLKMAGTCNIRYEVINHKVTTTVILVECSLWLAAGTLLIKPIRRVKYGKAVKKIENLKMNSYIFILNFLDIQKNRIKKYYTYNKDVSVPLKNWTSCEIDLWNWYAIIFLFLILKVIDVNWYIFFWLIRK